MCIRDRRDIYFNNRKGLYAFRKGEIIKYLFFQEGDLIYAKSNQKEELIGNILFRLGKLHDEAFSHIDKFIEPMETIGSVLIKSGFISEDDLINGLTYQMREIVLNLFSEFEGEMGFQEREIPKERIYETRISIPILIEDGIRRMKYHPKLRAFLQDKALFQKNKDFFLQVRLKMQSIPVIFIHTLKYVTDAISEQHEAWHGKQLETTP